ncbi:SDR family oxidoreductase [Rhodobacter sp. 24-YEA-8]|uniref:SDR family oxidoreductase n=1 Tax=Rhodobacter sp. 24-YEA-8 TaxID=1884310 RepID=UPI000895C6E5|nr:SDR family oxidoreductase [Rhodobacter sp. 24-YEA-8]SEB84285.1 NADP-dependent 3-hydroxy acid dehydrogenase YdfG [Rhodobacter sp. 24-YEA-8]
MLNFNGKTAVITGAGRGLGAAFALSLASMGCALILCGRREADLLAISARVTAQGGMAPKVVELDLADAVSVEQAAARIAALAPKVDILINNGAMWLESRDMPYSDAEVLGVVNAAITGTFLLVQGIRPLMQASDAPDIVTIGSISGLPNAALQSVSVPFYAAKRGQVALAEGLRQDFIGSKFRSILINPPYLDDAIPDQPDWAEAALRDKGQRGTGRDVVEAAVFALTRPRHVSLTIDVDADEGGLFS